ncbi:CAP domain-containing protein [Caballeronia sp. M23-90]
MGLSTLSNSVPSLTTAASSHSTYVVLNNTSGHTETAGLPGFTGADPSTRIQAAYKNNFWGEVVVAFTGPHAAKTFAAENIFDAPYHRGVLMADYAVSGVGFVTSGTGASLYSALTIDLADYKQVVGASQFVAYPYNNQKGVKTSWVAEESPNVFADQPQYIGQTVGHPIVSHGTVNSVIDISSFTLKDAAGNNVACKAQDHNTSSDAASFGICVPYAPLASNVTYSASVTGWTMVPRFHSVGALPRGLNLAPITTGDSASMW